MLQDRREAHLWPGRRGPVPRALSPGAPRVNKGAPVLAVQGHRLVHRAPHAESPAHMPRGQASHRPAAEGAAHTGPGPVAVCAANEGKGSQEVGFRNEHVLRST